MPRSRRGDIVAIARLSTYRLWRFPRFFDEAELTPKPALVDRQGNGAHHDLDLARLRRSAHALQDGFVAIARAAAVESRSLLLREQIGRIGRDMERRMMAATDGGNAHRGAIWALGLLVAAAAQRRSERNADRIAAEAAALARLPDRFAPRPLSNGERARLRFGAAGARGEAQAAFPHAIRVGLPTLARRVAEGCRKTARDLMPSWPSWPVSTIPACSIAAVLPRSRRPKRVLEPCSPRAGRQHRLGWRRLHRLHAELMALWASPGGSADLLAVTLFLDRLEGGSRSVSSTMGVLLMETLNFEYEAKGPLTRRAHVGVVGSGDLEVLIEPSDKPTAQVRVRTSVDGYAQVWKSVLDRFFSRFELCGESGDQRLRGNARDGDLAARTGRGGGAVMMHATHSDNPITKERRDRFLSRQSVIEMRARERARALLDPGSFRELLGPFDRLESPWLPLQGIVPESDDGVIIARGQLAGQPAVIMAIEGAFQGGGMGEVSASKIAGALALARRDCESGKPILPVLLLETGGVRLQEANLGEAVVAEIHAEIIALRRHVPVIGVITGMVGCFGGMSIAAGLCSYLVVFPQARLELNGPEVIEQEAGIDELDASDKHLIWSLIGGEQRFETGFADALIEDDAKALRQTIAALAARGVPARHRSEKVEEFRRSLAKIDPAAPPDGPELRRIWPKGEMP